MDVTLLSNEDLIYRLKILKAQEDFLIVEILDHVLEIDRRKLFLVLGYSSLFAYLTKDIGYTDGSAYRRSESARFLPEVPEVRQLLRTGQLSMTATADIRTAIRKHEEITGKLIPQREKLALVEECAKNNGRDTQKILAEKFPGLRPTNAERKIEMPGGGLQLQFEIDKYQRATMETARDILARTRPMDSLSILLESACEFVISKRDYTKGPMTQHFSASGETLRYIPLALRRAIFKRDEGRCQFQTKNGRICHSTYDVALDHIIPFSKGGKTEYTNLRCLCRPHNQEKAERDAEV